MKKKKEKRLKNEYQNTVKIDCFKLKESKGITLSALIVTIIVLIILAGVSINYLIGDNQIAEKAKGSKEQYEIASVKEQARLDIVEWQFEQMDNDEKSYLNDEIVKDILSKPTLKEYIKEIDGNKVITQNGYEIEISELYEEEIPKWPNSYQTLNYIESTGTQWINTGIIPNENMKFDVEIAFITTDSTSYVFGADKNYYTGYNMAIDWSRRIAEGVRGIFGGKQNGAYMIQSKVNPIVGKKYKIVLEKNKITVDSTVNNNTSNWAEIEISWPIVLFATNRNETIMNLHGLRIYSFKVYENEKLIQSLIPCYNRINNEIGFYDVVNDSFLTNQGTGEFIKGEEV